MEVKAVKANKYNAGSRKGIPNRTTAELRGMVNLLVANEFPKVIDALDKVRKVNPAKYVEYMQKFIEMTLPKLAPVESDAGVKPDEDWYAEQAKKMMKKAI